MEILPIAASSLNAASRATAVRANNIVNATTPNYASQAPVYSSQIMVAWLSFSKMWANPST